MPGDFVRFVTQEILRIELRPQQGVAFRRDGVQCQLFGGKLAHFSGLVCDFSA